MDKIVGGVLKSKCDTFIAEDKLHWREHDDDLDIIVKCGMGSVCSECVQSRA